MNEKLDLSTFSSGGGPGVTSSVTEMVRVRGDAVGAVIVSRPVYVPGPTCDGFAVTSISRGVAPEVGFTCSQLPPAVSLRNSNDRRCDCKSSDWRTTAKPSARVRNGAGHRIGR